LRFVYALHGQGIAPRYEIAGEGQSTIDFGFTNKGRQWRVELLRLGETRAVREATKSTVAADGIPWTIRILCTDADDPRQSTEGETLKAIERICQKCESKGRPYKFPVPDDSYHAMIVDLGTFVNGGDVYDRVHVALGAECSRRRTAFSGKTDRLRACSAQPRICAARRSAGQGCTFWVSSASARLGVENS